MGKYSVLNNTYANRDCPEYGLKYIFWRVHSIGFFRSRVFQVHPCTMRLIVVDVLFSFVAQRFKFPESSEGHSPLNTQSLTFGIDSCVNQFGSLKWVRLNNKAGTYKVIKPLDGKTGYRL